MVRFLLWLPIAVVAPTIAYAQGADSLLLQCGLTAGSDKCVYETSIIQLLARPEVYDGKRVRLAGYIHFEFEGNGIYLHREDEQRNLFRNGFWVQVKEGSSIAPQCQDRYVLVEGTFVSRNHGHLGLWSGAIVDITRCTPRG